MVVLTELDHLVSQSKWEDSGHLAQTLLEGGTLRPDEAAHLNWILCKSRLMLRDYLGAVPYGEESVALAVEHGLWDKVARALHDLAVAYYFMRRYQDQVALTGRFQEYRERYTQEGLRYEGHLWLLTGLSYRNGLGDLQKAKAVLDLAASCFQHDQDHTALDRVRREMVQTLLLMGDLDAVTPLLKAGEEYAKARPKDVLAQFDQAYDTCKYLRSRGRHVESVKAGLRALHHAKGRPVWEHCTYMALSETASATKDFQHALGFALSARLSAMEANRYDLEYAAVSVMINLIRETGPEVVMALDKQYKLHGLDVFQYIPESILHREQKGGA